MMLSLKVLIIITIIHLEFYVFKKQQISMLFNIIKIRELHIC
jgi:hypothetical protein